VMDDKYNERVSYSVTGYTYSDTIIHRLNYISAINDN